MATLNLGKLYHNGSQVFLQTVDIYDKATKKYLSARLSDIDTSIAGLESAIAGKAPVKVVANISARDALTGVITGDLVWVTDASSDQTVTSGAACYLASVSGEPATTTWTKVAEAESMDLVINWADIQNKPSSTTSAIDQAVTDSHTHANSTVLAGLSADGTSGNLVYNNVELGKYTGIASGATLAGATDYSDKLQIVLEAYDPEAQQAGA